MPKKLQDITDLKRSLNMTKLITYSLHKRKSEHFPNILFGYENAVFFFNILECKDGEVKIRILKGKIKLGYDYLDITQVNIDRINDNLGFLNLKDYIVNKHD